VLSASASGYTPSPLNSNPFNVVKADGQLGCNNTNNFAGNPAYDPNTEGPFMGTAGIGLRRGPNTDDPTGANCVLVPFTLSIDAPNNTASFIADKKGQNVIVEYVVVWKASATVNGWPPERHPQLAWGPGLANPPTAAQYIDGLACNNDDVTASPLPIIPSVPPYSTSSIAQYQPDGLKTAAMCIAQQGWTSVSTGMVQFWNRIIDTDGFIRNP